MQRRSEMFSLLNHVDLLAIRPWLFCKRPIVWYHASKALSHNFPSRNPRLVPFPKQSPKKLPQERRTAREILSYPKVFHHVHRFRSCFLGWGGSLWNWCEDCPAGDSFKTFLGLQEEVPPLVDLVFACLFWVITGWKGSNFGRFLPDCLAV